MNTKGVSLVELMTVIGIACILSALAIPPYISWRNNSALRGAALGLIVDMQKARVHSLNDQSYVVLSFSENAYTVFVDDGEGGATAGNWNREDSELLLCSRTLAEGVRLQSNFPGNRFRFKGFGRNIPGRVIVKYGDSKSFDVIVNVLGRIRVESNS